ncbi:acyltransferase family protein [Ornithinimicrobium cavernae]|uniref:acyltransferase family protein n=1 Tax=Ornithinimicrobium cavernae TaxID=2666047 RepID=UPI0013795CF4|nr:acyltransferase family protein [Ornithinimicrobium cavernae]
MQQTRRPRHSRGSGSTGGSPFRGDIEGLRAIAVLLVLVYHAGVAEVSGGFVGVDVFFVVSGFVITNQLVREVESTGRLSLWGFYGRRAKRLLPAAGLVLVTTSVVAWLMASRVQWQTIGGDIAAAAAYVVNWGFAARSVDYLAEDVQPSPVLHFWSLAVEEQFYLLWPVLILGLLALARLPWRRRTAAGDDEVSPGPVQGRLALGLLVVLVLPSFLFSVLYTQQAPSEAFFITPTRLWELGLGALVALGAGVFESWGRFVAGLVAWLGLGVLLSSAFLVDATTAWPGYAALAPVLGTAAVIAGGFRARRWGPAGLLGLRPFVWVGGLSYSLYLWHWPLLRFWEWEFGTPSVWQGLVIVAASFLPAWLAYTFVETPVRHAPALSARPRYALSVGANCSLAALLAGVLLVLGALGGTSGGGQSTGAGWSTDGSAATAPGGQAEEPSGADDPGSAGDPQEPGTTGPPLPGEEQPGDEPFFDRLTPDPLEATADVPGLYASGCQIRQDDDSSEPCDFGDLDSDVVVAVVGDSKAAQWIPALERIGEEQGWLIRTYTKQTCAFADVLQLTPQGEPYTTCRDWGRDVLERLTGEERPTVVLASGVRSEALPTDDATTESTQALVDGYVRYWSALREEGVGVIALSDTPSPDGDVGPVYECVDEHRDDPGACSWPYDPSPGTEALQEAVNQVEGAQFVDMGPWVCPGGTCVGDYRNVMTYRQGSHITATFAEVLAEPLAAYLAPLVETFAADPPGDEGRGEGPAG